MEWEVPVSLELVGEGNDRQSLVFQETIRSLPNVRISGRGTWDGRDVFIKLFLDPHRSRSRADREQKAAGILDDRGILTPTLLHRGQTLEGDHPVLIYEFMTGVSSCREVLDRTPAVERVPIIQALVSTVATQHEKGIIQRDQHFGNYGLADSTIMTFDAGAMEFRRDALDTHTAADNLGLLLAQLDPRIDGSIGEYVDLYNSGRDASRNHVTPSEVETARNQHRRTQRNRFFRKIVRTCSECEAGRSGRRSYVLRRDESEAGFPDSLVNAVGLFSGDPDTESGRSVSIEGLDRELVAWQPGPVWRRPFSRSGPAVNAWRASHWLMRHGLATPRPVALIEERSLFLKHNSVLVTQGGSWRPCSDFFSDPNVSSQRKEDAGRSIIALIRELGRIGIRHGGLDHGGVLVDSTDKPLLSDLWWVSYQEESLKEGEDESDFLSRWDSAPDMKAFFDIRESAVQD